MSRFYIAVTALAFTACNAGAGKQESGSATDTVAKHIGSATTINNKETGDPGAEFSFNGEPALYDASTHNVAHFTNGGLHVYLNGYFRPDTHNHQLELWIKNFAEKTGEYTAIVNYARKNDKKEEFIYDGKDFKVNITTYERTGADTTGSLMKNVMHPRAYVSGNFSGDLLFLIPNPALKSDPLAQPQHVAGRFDHLKVIFLQ